MTSPRPSPLKSPTNFVPSGVTELGQDVSVKASGSFSGATIHDFEADAGSAAGWLRRHRAIDPQRVGQPMHGRVVFVGQVAQRPRAAPT